MTSPLDRHIAECMQTADALTILIARVQAVREGLNELGAYKGAAHLCEQRLTDGAAYLNDLVYAMQKDRDELDQVHDPWTGDTH